MSDTAVKDIAELHRAVGPAQVSSVIQRSARPVQLDRQAVSRYDDADDELELPPIKSARRLIEQNLGLPDVVVHGLLHQGSKMVLGGGSKSFKTWCLGDLALSVANGVPWWGINTNKGRVLYINFEIQEGFFAHRLNDIASAKGLAIESLAELDTWNLRGHCADLSKLMTKLLKEIPKNHYSLIVVDPIYKGLGGRDENSAGDVATLLNEVERLAVQSGAAVVFGAHFSKGNQAAKESIDRISGSGVFARDPDTILVMTKHENEYTYTVEPTLRNFAPMDPFCVRWNHPLMQRDENADPDKLKVQGKKVAKYTSQQLLEVLGDQELLTMEWYLQTAHRIGIGKRTFMEKLAEIKDDGNLLTKTATNKWKAANPAPRKENAGAEVRDVHSAPAALDASGAVKSVRQAAL